MNSILPSCSPASITRPSAFAEPMGAFEVVSCDSSVVCRMSQGQIRSVPLDHRFTRDSDRKIMVEVQATSMVGRADVFHRKLIHRGSFRACLRQAGFGPPPSDDYARKNTARDVCALTTPSFLSSGTRISLDIGNGYHTFVENREPTTIRTDSKIKIAVVMWIY
jgi:hypothetical protein